LRALASPLVVEVRGEGLLVGVELKTAVAPILAAARQRGLLIINAGDTTLRIAPPLIVTRDHIDAAVAILGACLVEEEKRLTQRG
ncbi:MAG TPA: aminotransferase class III-fold pyridoxal phosphate-dependent enzyme, partial [Promineifilum sp.]|nr:aminotransferase class III-fold pyridoxal phosphate-dependent enzyme [Promineifilum sp.]